MKACRRSKRRWASEGLGVDAQMPQLAEVDFYTSHEALLLWYEEALTREDSLRGRPTIFRPRGLATGPASRPRPSRILRGVENPIGIKVGPSSDPDEIVLLTEILNPTNEAGFTTLIVRMGATRCWSTCPGSCGSTVPGAGGLVP